MTAATSASAPKTSTPAAIATRVRRLMAVPAGSRLFAQDVADPADGLDQPRLPHFPPKVADVDPQPVRFRAEVVSPHRFEYLGAGKHPARVAEEEFEQREFGFGERQGLAAAAGLVRGQVQLGAGEPEHVGA